MPTLLLTGATGYIGGHTLQHLTLTHPEWSITVLLRTESQAKIISNQYPTSRIKIFVGSLKDLELVGKCAAEADVVLRIEIIISHMSQPQLQTHHGKKLFIQLSPLTALLNTSTTGYGSPSSTIYHDSPSNPSKENITHHFPPSSPEHAIIATGNEHGVSTAILCPSLIYGVGQGPVRKRGCTVPYLIEAVMKRGRGFTVGEGRNVMSCTLCHVYNSKSLTHPPSTSGFYFLASSPPNNDISFNEITTAIVNNCRARNIIQSTEIERLSPGQAAQIHPWAPMLWGANCRGFSDRLRELGWEARGRGLRESLDEMVEFEVGLLKGQREELVGTWKTDVAIVAEEAVCCF
ncbi:hypothetical protein DL95DRAFT_499320 [Leptodontidium sp. 2 PMI_412]|nr:hypothetical protein DL95DRAFT_499320 [Leptodontidium sp. 2 PMI_412]